MLTVAFSSVVGSESRSHDLCTSLTENMNKVAF